VVHAADVRVFVNKMGVETVVGVIRCKVGKN
jgi:hypothetical protein